MHQYLQELGQGVQHMACRVQNLPHFIMRANKYREVTGEGLSFLNIPRSYYGYLQEKQFPQLSDEQFELLCSVLSDADIIDKGRVVRMEASLDDIVGVLTAPDN